MLWAVVLVSLLVPASVLAQPSAGDEAAKANADTAKEQPAKLEDASKAEDKSGPNPETAPTTPPADSAAKPNTDFSRASIGAPNEPLPAPGAEAPEPPRTRAPSTETEDFWHQYRPRADEIELGYFLGLLGPSSRHNFHRQTLPQQDIDTGAFFGTRIGYFPLDLLGVELEAGMAPTASADGRAAEVWTLRGDVMAQLPLLRVTPFVVLGGGRMGVFSNSLGNDGDPLLDFGVGAKFGLSDVVSARLDLRDDLTQKTRASDGSLTHSFELTLGITVRVPTTGAPPKEEHTTPPVMPAAPPAPPNTPALPVMDPFSPEPRPAPNADPANRQP
jgi:hypothetical protein